jgi:hypothetical protein
MVALQVGAEHAAVVRVVAVAPPLAMGEIAAPARVPTLLLAGDRDTYCPVAAVATFAARLAPGSASRVLAGADHFFGGYEPAITAACATGWPRIRGETRVACDSLVALGGVTDDGATLFAKNSDRPAAEPQPLAQRPAQRHAPGERVRCTYVEIPQVTETARVIGSRPYWCWGFEHGLNEHGVTIGNHTVFTKDGSAHPGSSGWISCGSASSARAARRRRAEVITALAEAHGQGGSGYADKDWPYHNSFLIADRREAYRLETSDRRWALRRVADMDSVSNHLGIGADWDALAEGTIEHAIEQGWWSEDAAGRFDFAAAYRDTSTAPDIVSSGRHRRTCELLAAGRGA